MNRYLLRLFTTIILFAPAICLGQDRGYLSGLQSKMNAYSADKASLLFVHFDKNVYTNNESIWFTGYILRADSMEVAAHHTLSVALVSDATKNSVLDENFLIQNGIGSGNIILPDTISPGDYHLIACTNLLGKAGRPLVTFSQPITIKSISVQSFNASVTLQDSGAHAGAPMKVNIHADVESSGGSQKSPTFKVRYRIGQMVAYGVTDATGNFVLEVDPKRITPATRILLADVLYKKEIKHLLLKLPYKEKSVVLRFYPEGGYLAEGLLNTIGWEAKTADNKSVSVQGILYKDKQALDTLSTNAYGVGKFRLVPQAGSSYSIKLKKGEIQDRDTSYQLPNALGYTPVISISKAVVSDTLKVTLRSKQAMKLHVLVDNFRDIFSVVDISTNVAGTNLKIALGEIPKGVTALTVMDSAYRPLAERLFFAHYNNRKQLLAKTDKDIYTTRENVELKLKLTGVDGKTPVDGAVSVACVQDNRITFANQQDIEGYTYLNSELGKLPLNPLGRGLEDKEYMENVLLVKGWRKYNWLELKAIDTASANAFRSVEVTGTVTRGEHTLKAPVNVSLIGDSTFSIMSTDDKGVFDIPPDKIVTYHDKKIMLTVNRKDKAGFEIKVNYPYANLFDKIIAEDPNLLNISSLISIAGDTKNTQLTGTENIHLLKEVKISGRKDDAVYGANLKGTRNECGDYVCIYNILNCPNHPFNGRPPVVGQTYIDYRSSTVVYQGCDPPLPNFYIIKGIKAAKTFYPADYSLGLSAPDYQSTIYWNNLLELKNGEATVKFPTSDITGPYRIVVQGVTGSDVIFESRLFNVKKQLPQ